MKNVLCYGDSNTFGFNPEDGSRFDKSIRWTGVLQSILGEEYNVIEMGANNRNGFVENPSGILYSANKHFPQMIAKYDKIDYLILSIGTNDLQFLYDTTYDDVEKGLELLITSAKDKVETFILVPTVVLNNDVVKGFFKFQFDKTSIEKSEAVISIYEKIARKYDLIYFDINKFVKPSPKDGLHYDVEEHRIIAQKYAEIIKGKNYDK